MLASPLSRGFKGGINVVVCRWVHLLQEILTAEDTEIAETSLWFQNLFYLVFISNNPLLLCGESPYTPK